MAHPLVQVRNLWKRFTPGAQWALQAINAELYPGRMTGLVGPDGAGKTTLIRLMVGLLKADQGQVLVRGLSTVDQAEAIHGFTGYMPQKFGLYEDLTVFENLRLYAELRQVSSADRREKFNALLKFTALERFQSRLAGKLSGGMKQKLGLACALMGTPQLLLLDEPSVGVDPISRRELWKMVRELLTQGLGVVWSTSYLDEAEQCDKVILLDKGKTLFDGPPQDLLVPLQGRVWQVQNLRLAERRMRLTALLSKPEVLDGVIQGKDLRIVLRAGQAKPGPDLKLWRQTAPRFEDAFIEMLGGAPKGPSLLAENIDAKTTTGDAVIDAQNLCKRFGSFDAVRNVSFRIGRGEIFGLLGPNGAGKSTTFKMMCGLLQPTQGKAAVMGFDLKKAGSYARSRIGYMAQKFSLYEHLTVFQNLRFFSGLYGLAGAKQKMRMQLMLDLFDFEPYAGFSAKDLPLGFKQRLALACAVMHEPDVLFLDEPTSGVDPITRREFWMHINAMVNKGVTVMVTTHFMDEAEYCDRIALIYQGHSIATGTPDELKDKVVSQSMPEPTLEDAFIALVQENAARLEESP